MSKTNEHFDKLGRPLTKGNCIAFAHHNDLRIGIVTKVCPVMISITELDGQRIPSTYRKYPQDMVIVDGPEVTMYCLKHST